MPVIVQPRCCFLLFVCGEYSAPNRTPFRPGDKNCSPCHRNGVHFHNGILFGFTTEWCSASDRNRVHLRPDSPSSRWPLTFTRSTQNPLSSLWNVTRSISPEICSVVGWRSEVPAFMRGIIFPCHGRDCFGCCPRTGEQGRSSVSSIRPCHCRYDWDHPDRQHACYRGIVAADRRPHGRRCRHRLPGAPAGFQKPSKSSPCKWLILRGRNPGFRRHQKNLLLEGWGGWEEGGE